MDILHYFKEVKDQKQINKLAKKYKNKKIVIYGAGEYYQILQNNFDLSKLNIVGISDKKFETSKDHNPSKYLALTPEELKNFDFDAILVALYDDVSICDFIQYQLLINTINEDKPVKSLIEPTLFFILKVLLGK